MTKHSPKSRFKKLSDRVGHKLFFNQWTPIFKFSKHFALPVSFEDFIKIVPPKDRFWADPFVISRDGTYYIFVEEFKYQERKGVIAVIELNADGKHFGSRVVLEKDYHLSYPFLFEENGELFMMPETSRNRTIELYRCVEFPMRWELETVILDDISAVDTTLLKHEDKYWLFTNEKLTGSGEDMDLLSIYYSDNLFNGSWTAHPANPVVKDIKSARPAGNFFCRDGRIFRPSQNCSKHYGYGITISEIIELTETRYHEEPIQTILPDFMDNVISAHTLNTEDGLIVADALIRRSKWI